MTPYRKKEFYQGGYYHIYNRGASRGSIFFSEENYLHCLKLMKKYLEHYNISLIVYCLMPNHYHFILRQDSEKSISFFMRDIFNAYVQAVNIQQSRSGALFEGRFKHIHIDKNEYVLHLCRYIHLNPVNANLISSPADWKFSNYLDWIGKRNGQLTDIDFMKDNFNTCVNYRKFVMEYQEEEDYFEKIQKYVLE